jgi:hypothetical protein
MKELFEKTREFILHLDGSAEAGDEIIFTAKEGITEITIDSWIMPSESRHYIKPFLQHIKDTYEMPLVVIREMSKEISSAVSEIFPGISHQICHSHFIRNLSDILFKHRYKSLRNKMINTKVPHKFLSLKKKYFEGTTSLNKIVATEHYWVILAVEYLLYPRERRPDYPFVLPYLEIMNRVMEIKSMIRKIVNNEEENLDIVRHNALEELNHRWSRVHIRRRTGRNKTTKEMTKYGTLLAILSNLENEDYVKVVFGVVGDFVRDLQNITDEELREARQLIRKFPQCPLIKSDVKRPEILREFVGLVEDDFNDV